MSRYSLRARILGGLLTSFLVLAIISFATIYRVHKVVNQNHNIPEIQHSILELQLILRSIYEIESAQRGFVIANNQQFIEAAKRAKETYHVVINNLSKRVDSLTPHQVNTLDELAQKRIKLADQIIELSKNSITRPLAGKIIARGDGHLISQQISSLVFKYTRILQPNLEKRVALSEKTLLSLVRWTFIALGFTLILILIGSYFLIRSISSPLSRITEMAEHMSEGDLRFRIKMERQDELGRLANVLDSMANRIENQILTEKDLSNRLELISAFSILIGTDAIKNKSTVQEVLQTFINKARELTGAGYAALGINYDHDLSYSPWLHSFDESSINEINLSHNGINAPIKFQNERIGSLYLSNTIDHRQFSEDDKKAIDLLTSQIAVIIENVRLQSELRNAIGSRDNVLAVVSHDLKNPLGIILSASDIIKEPDSDLSDDEKTYMLDAIKRSAIKMKHLISDLLDAAAIESGKLSFNLASKDMRQILFQQMEELKILATEKSIVMTCDDLPSELTVNCDEHRLQQAMSNLVGNAIKFTPIGGHVTVSVRQADNQYRFEIQDDGPGIKDTEMKKLFDRYWRPKGTKESGQGLGLYITKGIIEAHGGTLDVESDYGHGSKFIFTVPVSHESQLRS